MFANNYKWINGKKEIVFLRQLKKRVEGGGSELGQNWNIQAMKETHEYNDKI